MTFADSGNKRVTVTGPTGLLHFLASRRMAVMRSSMELKHTEVPSSTVEDATPAPVFVDDRITVYAFPIHAEHATTEPTDEKSPSEAGPSIPAKRKRSSSPAGPSKRPPTKAASDHELDESVATAEDAIHPDEAEAAADTDTPDYNTLCDTDPQKWRTLIVNSMFPLQGPELTPEEEFAIRKRTRREQKMRENYLRAGLPIPPALRQPSTAPSSQPKFTAIRSDRGRRLPRFTYGPEGRATLCYVLVGPTGRGHFDREKAELLQVPRGPERARLTKGETVKFMVDDGAGNKIERTVTPEECMGPPEIPRAMVLLDVPTPSHIPDVVKSFTQNPFYSEFHSNPATDPREPVVHVVYHLCGKGVLEDERYKAFMRGFPEDTHQVVSSREHGDDRVVFSRAAYNQLRLGLLDPDMFPLPTHRPGPRRDLSSIPGLPARVEHLRHSCHVELRPAREPCIDPFAKPDFFTPVIEAGAGTWVPEDVHRAFLKAKKKISKVKEVGREPRSGDNVEIVPLGTCSALASLYRNASSTLVRIPGHGSILLDAGEGTWGQLARLYGDDGQDTVTGVWEVLRDLRCIFASHMHGDHHLGLSKILAMRKLLDPAPTQPLYFIGLPSHIIYLEEHSELEDLGLNQADGNGVIAISGNHLRWNPKNSKEQQRRDIPEHILLRRQEKTQQDVENMYNALGLKCFTTVDVAHRTKCYGTVIEHRDGWRIVFSADTMPSNKLVEAGQNATLLIHEATMADDQEEMAHDKAHSTFSQAMKVASDMQAENILLTHFSARYPRMPPTTSLPDSPRASPSPGPHLGLAFDQTRFTIGDMWKMKFYLRAIELNMGDVAQDDDEDTMISSWD
ncbi:uncharacterized protein B0H18DRAFT_437455 [Fomitopsis serialis]|uniref:uncharacterized protein n=1 Tax=Fomitopsis serialis TaxID=139415 RepID=UPI002008D3B2|nr:uncharacterized protein B0H18DRAFT_437455 [Neoantrodia serialis]KAH9924163.1 hypothetical protein B0H18DRAFT_437455 [Neoantrodia serialis]